MSELDGKSIYGDIAVHYKLVMCSWDVCGSSEFNNATSHHAWMSHFKWHTIWQWHDLNLYLLKMISVNYSPLFCSSTLSFTEIRTICQIYMHFSGTLFMQKLHLNQETNSLCIKRNESERFDYLYSTIHLKLRQCQTGSKLLACPSCPHNALFC